MNALDHVEKTDEVLEARGAVDAKNKPHVAGDAAEPLVDLLVRGLLAVQVQGSLAHAIKKHPRHLFTFCQNDKSIFWLDPSTSREAAYHKACPICGADHGHLVVWIPDTVTDFTNEAGAGAKRSDNCPCCGSVNSMRLFGARAVTLASAMVGHLNSSSANLDPKLIAFSDSVQDAAHRAGFMQARGYTYTIRQAVAGLIRDNNRATSQRSSDPAKDPMSLFNILSDLSDYWKERIGRRSELTGNHADDIALTRFVTTFTPSDMMWRRPWLKFRAASSGMPENQSASDRSPPISRRLPSYATIPTPSSKTCSRARRARTGKRRVTNGMTSLTTSRRDCAGRPSLN